MNFAQMMSAEIAKQQLPPSTSGTQSLDRRSPYVKKADVEAAREASYRAEHEAKEMEKADKAVKKRKLEEEEAERETLREAKRQRLAAESKKRRIEEEQKEERERRKRLGLSEVPPAQDEDGGREGTPLPQGEDDIPENELLPKLRELSEPARLFGETHVQRILRYRRLERSRSDTPSDAMSSGKAKTVLPTSLEPVSEIDMKVPAKAPSAEDKEGRLLLARQLTAWFNLVLKEWAIALASRPEETKKTFTGQAAANSMSSAVNELKPLFRRLEKINTKPEDLPNDLLDPIAEIVYNAQERRYVKANDGYLQLSIGKAAWPIGVTMVGIHERSAREKLHESDKGKAHIMTDEATRKILQSIKRCLTFAQTRWPPDDIGQMMG